jgi:hypothetical protein
MRQRDAERTAELAARERRIRSAAFAVCYGISTRLAAGSASFRRCGAAPGRKSDFARTDTKPSPCGVSLGLPWMGCFAVNRLFDLAVLAQCAGRCSRYGSGHGCDDKRDSPRSDPIFRSLDNDAQQSKSFVFWALRVVRALLNAP